MLYIYKYENDKYEADILSKYPKTLEFLENIKKITL
jgi:hypothetical protein